MVLMLLKLRSFQGCHGGITEGTELKKGVSGVVSLS